MRRANSLFFEFRRGPSEINFAPVRDMMAVCGGSGEN